MKLDVTCMRYLTKDDYRVLTAVEMGMRNHEMVPVSLITSIAQLRHGGSYKILSVLLRYKLVAHTNQEYDGYRLSYLGYDILALHTLQSRNVIATVGNQIGIGKESDIFEAQDVDGNDLVIKIHRLGRTSFRAVRSKRDYLQGRSKASWLYMSRLAAIKEFAFMKALYAHGFPVPIPVDANRHVVVMERIRGFPLAQIKSGNLPHADVIYAKALAILKRLAQCGLVHCDFNEFNLMLQEDSDTPALTLIDFPQMVSTSHVNAAELLERDINCLMKFFAMKMRYVPPEGEAAGFRLDDIVEEVRIDQEVAASGFEGEEDVLQSIQQGMLQAQVEQEEGEGDEGEEAEAVPATEDPTDPAAEAEGEEDEDLPAAPTGPVFDDFQEKRLADAYSRLRGEILHKGGKSGAGQGKDKRNATKKRNKYGRIVKADKMDI